MRDMADNEDWLDGKRGTEDWLDGKRGTAFDRKRNENTAYCVSEPSVCLLGLMIRLLFRNIGRPA